MEEEEKLFNRLMGIKLANKRRGDLLFYRQDSHLPSFAPRLMLSGHDGGLLSAAVSKSDDGKSYTVGRKPSSEDEFAFAANAPPISRCQIHTRAGGCENVHLFTKTRFKSQLPDWQRILLA